MAPASPDDHALMDEENGRMKAYGWVLIAVLGLVAASRQGVTASNEEPANPARAIPPGPLGDVIRLGETLVEQTSTHPLSKPYVGNALNCTSCHLDNGKDPNAASFIGVASAYPAWSPREKRVVTLEDRVLNCFMRSCNGVRPPLGSQASVAVTAYITWLSTDMPLRMNPSKPNGPRAVPPLAIAADKADPVRGEAIYAEKCASCHAKNGEGRKKNPPVWGSRSYNQGAGLAQPIQLAAWLKVAMPLDDPDLTEQEALDVAAFVDSHDRPAFKLEDHLPPPSKLGEYNAEPESPRH
jgi:thiosulfate dehydrogenase